MPSFIILLNKNPSFNKGVTKVLKMISNLNPSMLLWIQKGLLSKENKFSLLRHMVKKITCSTEEVVTIHTQANLMMLIQNGFFEMNGSMPNLANEFNGFRLNNL